MYMTVPLPNSRQSKRIRSESMVAKEQRETLHLRRKKKLRAIKSFAMVSILEKAPVVMVPNAASSMKTELAMLVVKARAKEGLAKNKRSWFRPWWHRSLKNAMKNS